MVTKGFSHESCEIAMNIALRNYNKYKKKICGFCKICSRQDKGNYLECGISKIKENAEEMQNEVRRRTKIMERNKERVVYQIGGDRYVRNKDNMSTM